jgi:hypothetical protein
MIETIDEAISPIIFSDQHFIDFGFAGGIGLDDVAWR